jgi:hypothetical protein
MIAVALVIFSQWQPVQCFWASLLFGGAQAFSVLFYSWCRVSALISLSVADYYERGGTRWLRFEEKRGKDHEGKR